MSDTNTVVTTPPPDAPSTPAAPSQVQVPVNENPVQTPTPLGNQAPPKPEGQEARQSSNISRRETIKNAFEKAKQAQSEAAEKPPAKKPEAKPQQQQHREQGRFARDPSKQPPADQQPNQQNQQAANAGEVADQNQNRGQVQGHQPTVQNYDPLPDTAPFRQPPTRFSEQAKSDWNGAPESVRGAVHQMVRQFKAAHEKYRADSEAMNELRPFHDLATKQGTSLSRVLQNYVGIEQKIRGDVFGGFDVITRNLNLKHEDGSPVTFRDVAYTYLSQSPEQHQLSAQQNQTQATTQQIAQLYETVNQLAQSFGHMQYEKQFNNNLNKVDQFAASHPRFNELAAAIKQEIDLGFPLEVAYKRAEMLHPAQAAQTRTQSAQTRRTSISGAPDGGNGKTPATTRSSDERQRSNGEAKQHPSRRESIAKAMRRASNGM